MKRFLLALSLFAVLLLSRPGDIFAATINYSPTSGTKYVGTTFTVTVLVDTGGVAANSFQADIRFPSDKLEVTSISTGGSICTLFPFQPSFGAGTAQIQCGLPSPGYNGHSGKLGTVTFSAKAVGTAPVTLASTSQVLANDGSGTNITYSLGSATFTIANPPTSAPVVSSSTHPSESGWYKSHTVTLSWTGGYAGYSYEFNQSPEATPDQVSEGNAATVTYQSVADGVWYFAIRGNGTSGWSGTTHYRIQIDNASPNAFIPVVDPQGEIDRRPLISFQTTDALSGIDHYEIKLDNEDFARADNPYKPDRLTSGEHTFTVRALDKAGNFTDASVKVRVKEIPSPIITKPVSGVLKFLEKLEVTGTGKPDSVVTLYLDDKVIAQEVTVGKDGNWSYTYPETLFPGKFKLYAVVAHDGIESRPSNEVSLTVDASAISLGPLTLPGGLVIFTLLLLLAAAVGLAIYFFVQLGYKAHYAAGSLRDRIKSLREEMNDDMDKLEHQVQDDVEATLQDPDSAKMRDMEHQLENRVEKDIHATKDHLKEDIDRTEGGTKPL